MAEISTPADMERFAQELAEKRAKEAEQAQQEAAVQMAKEGVIFDGETP